MGLLLAALAGLVLDEAAACLPRLPLHRPTGFFLASSSSLGKVLLANSSKALFLDIPWSKGTLHWGHLESSSGLSAQEPQMM